MTEKHVPGGSLRIGVNQESKTRPVKSARVVVETEIRFHRLTFVRLKNENDELKACSGELRGSAELILCWSVVSSDPFHII